MFSLFDVLVTALYVILIVHHRDITGPNHKKWHAFLSLLWTLWNKIKQQLYYHIIYNVEGQENSI